MPTETTFESMEHMCEAWSNSGTTRPSESEARAGAGASASRAAPAARSTSRNASTARSACPTSELPNSVRPTPRLPLTNRSRPSSSSSFTRAWETACTDTPWSEAAFVKLPSLTTAQKYLSWFMFIRGLSSSHNGREPSRNCG